MNDNPKNGTDQIINSGSTGAPQLPLDRNEKFEK